MGVPDTDTVVQLGYNKGLVKLSESTLVSLMESPVEQTGLTLGRLASVENVGVPLKITSDRDPQVLHTVQAWDLDGVDLK